MVKNTPYFNRKFHNLQLALRVKKPKKDGVAAGKDIGKGVDGVATGKDAGKDVDGKDVKDVGKGVDGSIICCSALKTLSRPGFIDGIERATGKPVVTSMQAFMWQMVRAAGETKHLHGYGKLFREH